MTYKRAIGMITVVTLFLFAGAVHGAEPGLSTIAEQIAIAKGYVELKCDPCDYNIDYGNTYHAAEKKGVDEGIVRLECDPCDYNIDYGEKYHLIDK